MTAIDLKDTDPIIEGQEWFVCSYISPKYVKNAVRVIKSKGKEKPEIDMEVITAFKFRGCFHTEEEARERAKYLQTIDSTHNIAIGNSFKWFVLDPDLKHATDIHYHEEKLNQIMTAFDNQQKEIQMLEAERRKQAIEETKNSVKVNNEKVKASSQDSKAGSIEEIVDEYEQKHKQTESQEEIKKSLEDNLDKLKELIN